MVFTNKKNRIIYLLKRLSESPFDFLLHKVWILFCKKIAFLPNSPVLMLLVKITEYKLLKNSKDLNELKLSIGHFSSNSYPILSDLKDIVENGKYNCLGYGLVDINSENAFHTDCVHNYSWPQKHFSKIDFVCSNVRADVKIPWEKSRLQWLLLLTTYYASTNALGSEKSDILNCFYNWQEKNKFLIGVNWCSSMEVSIRVMNIVTIYRILSPYLNNTEVTMFLKSIAQHKLYLKLFPEISDIPGNHFLATEIGLNIIGSITNHTAKSFSKSFSYLDEVVVNQFNEDGMHIEYAPMYHRLCLDMVLLSFLFSNDKGTVHNNLASIKKVLKQGMLALRAVSSVGGKIAVFGDNDSGQVFWFNQDARDASLYFNLKNKSLNSNNSLLTEFLSMIFPAAFSSFTDLVEEVEEMQPLSSTAYPYHTVEADTFKLITRIGKLGLGERGAHDHDDNLSFWLFDDNDDVIVEMGCAPYTLSIIDREACISSSAHNVITPVSSERYSLVDGSIFKTVKGVNTALLTDKSKDKIKAKIVIDDFEHERTFMQNKQSIIIKDMITGTDELLRYNIYVNTLKLTVLNKSDSFMFTSNTGNKYTLEFTNGEIYSSEVSTIKFYPSYGTSENIQLLKSSFFPHSSSIEIEISKVKS